MDELKKAVLVITKQVLLDEYEVEATSDEILASLNLDILKDRIDESILNYVHRKLDLDGEGNNKFKKP